MASRFIPNEILREIVYQVVGEDSYIKIRRPPRCVEPDCEGRPKPWGLMTLRAVSRRFCIISTPVIFFKTTFHQCQPFIPGRGHGPLYDVFDTSMFLYTENIQNLVSANFDERSQGQQWQSTTTKHPQLFDKSFPKLRELSIHLPGSYRVPGMNESDSDFGLELIQTHTTHFHNYAWKQLLGWKNWNVKVCLEFLVVGTELDNGNWIDTDFLIIIDSDDQIWIRGETEDTAFQDVEMVLTRMNNTRINLEADVSPIHDLFDDPEACYTSSIKTCFNIPESLKIVRRNLPKVVEMNMKEYQRELRSRRTA